MKSMKGLHQSSSFTDISTSRGGAEVWSCWCGSGLSRYRSLIEGLCRSWMNTPAGTRARQEPSLESTSASTLLFCDTC
jgi:hypothetical protein